MSPQKVLIVEDDEDLRGLYRLALALAGFTVAVAPGGLEALRHLDNDPPDIVVLDLSMPGIDGYDVRRELEAHAHTRSIPVLVVTGLPSVDSSQLNVSCVLTKPVGPPDLVAAVKRCLAVSDVAGV